MEGRNKIENSKSSDGSRDDFIDPKILERELNINLPVYNYKSSSEYAAAVNQWLWQCYNAHCMALTLPYMISQTACRPPTPSADGTIDFNRNFTNLFFPNQNLNAALSRRPNLLFQGINVNVAGHSLGRNYIIPSLYKRFAAEVIDFCILLVLKVMITYIAVDVFDLVNLDKYGIDLDFIRHDKLDYHKAMELTTEIITLEIVHRFVVCIFEALCIYKGVLGQGGATPGKTMMRLRVVSCQSVVNINPSTVRVYPARNLGFGWALLRAFIKNFSLAFVFPIFFTMYFFQHNRTAYDIICNSIVVEDLPDPTRNRMQQ